MTEDIIRGFWSGFWRSFNCSRCKTVLAGITLLSFLAFCGCEITGNHSETLKNIVLGSIVYWGGRATKVQEHLLNKK